MERRVKAAATTHLRSHIATTDSTGTLVEPEADLCRDLEAVDRAVNDVSTNGHDFEPFDVTQRLSSLRDSIASSVGDALARASDNLNDLIYVVCHRCSFSRSVRGRHPPRRPATQRGAWRDRVVTQAERPDGGWTLPPPGLVRSY